MIKEPNLENKVEYFDGNLPQPLRGQNTLGMFQTVSAVPTQTPKNWFDQIQYYKSGGTLRLYIYDSINNVWSYTALT